MYNSPSLSQPQDNAPMIGGPGRMPARSFNEAVRFLGNKTDRPYRPAWDKYSYDFDTKQRTFVRTEYGSPRATRVVKTDNGVGIKYHDTVVVEYTAEGLILNSGGYRTMTTKARINEALHDLSNAPYVSQNRGVWFISGMPFYDGVLVSWSGEILNAPADRGASEIKRITETTRLINAYVKEVMSRVDRVYAMTEDDYDPDLLPLPSGGDCWMCYMRTESGESLGDVTGDNHLMSHLEEVYIVPSLLLRAMREYEKPYGRYYASSALQALMEGNDPEKFWFEIMRRDLPKALRTYFKQRLAIGR